MNAEKLARLQSQVRIGGKGTPRRKVKKAHKSAGGEDKKLQSALQKLNVQNVAGIEEVNFFKTDTSVLHFKAPKVQASIASNTFAVYGTPENKDITELMPSIMGQLDLNTLGNLRARTMAAAEGTTVSGAVPAGDDDDVPDLVDAENFDQTD